MGPVLVGEAGSCPATARLADLPPVADASRPTWFPSATCLHEEIHADAEGMEAFLARDEDAAVFPLLEGLVGRFQRLLVSLDRPG